MSILAKPAHVDGDVLANLGPLAPLAGTWEGDAGLDISPTPTGPEETPYRERLVLEPVGPVVNGPQVLYGLRYATTAWPQGSADPFHEEVGYWLWDPERQLVMRDFIVPRGVTVSAGGEAAPDARSFRMVADSGDRVFGILSNPFLDASIDTVHYEVTITVHEDGMFSYEEDTVLEIEGFAELFHHKDSNRLAKVSG